MTYQQVKNLIAYHYWARDRILDALEPLTAEQFVRDLGSSFKSIRDTVVHAYGAELVWYSRWQGSSPTAIVPADSFRDLSAVRSAWQALERNVRSFIDTLGSDGVERRFSYTTLSGKPESSPLWQMVQHVVNHASYHRGQLTTMLRQLGGTPPKAMDLIAFYREQERIQEVQRQAVANDRCS
jgi:uncharacterized damage-inducible protein DinB